MGCANSKPTVVEVDKKLLLGIANEMEQFVRLSVEGSVYVGEGLLGGLFREDSEQWEAVDPNTGPLIALYSILVWLVVLTKVRDAVLDFSWCVRS